MSLVLCRPGIFFVLTFALLAQPAWGQRLGPLVKDNQQRSDASSAESTAAAVQPPSLRLSLPAPAVATLPPVGPDDLQRLQPQEGQASRHRGPPSPAARGGHAELLRGGRQDDRRGSVAIDRSRTPLAPEDDLPQRPCYAHSLSGLRHRGG